MSVLTFSAIVFAVSALAGFLGSLTGLGGGVVVTPVLTLLLGVDLHYAMGATLFRSSRHHPARRRLTSRKDTRTSG